MQPFTLLAAALALTLAGIFDSLAHFVGSLVIIASLVWSGFCLLSYLLRRGTPASRHVATAAAAIPRQAAPAPQAAAMPDAAIPDAIIAVIAAAVQTMLDEKHKIISIKPQDSSWEKAGRQAVLSSHRLR
ncbi:MAG: hypothetical protein WCJ66_10495 [Verrucomicrobiota bacterium]